MRLHGKKLQNATNELYYLEANFSAVQRKQFFDTFEHGIETSLLFQEGHVKYVFGPCPQL